MYKRQTLHRQNIAVDILPYDAAVDGYDLVVAPMLYMTKEGVAERLDAYVKNGGTLAVSYTHLPYPSPAESR